MCLITNIEEPFIAEKDIICYKQVSINSEGEIRTPYQNADVKKIIESSSKKIVEEYGTYNYQIDEQGVHAYLKIPSSIFALKAIIPEGTEFWISNDFSEIAATKLIISDEYVFATEISPDLIYLCELVHNLNVDYPKVHNIVLTRVNHYSARKFVEKLGKNWKLPTTKELLNIFSKLIYINADRLLHNENLIDPSYYYWSSKIINSTNARSVNGHYGGVSNDSRSNQSTYYGVLALSAF